ncbi:class D sortase [Amedibacillus sp. YH-ame6]
MKIRHRTKKIMTLIIAPLSFLIIGYGLMFTFSYPLLRPVMSIYSLISSEVTPNFNKKTLDLYNGEPGSSSGVVAYKNIKKPSYGDLYAKLSIAKINLDIDLYYGDSEEILEVAAGQFSGSYLAGCNRTILIAGHTIPFFRQFDELVKGDVVQISTSYGVFQYKITETKIGNFNDSNMYDLSQKEKEQLIMYTCYPLDGIGFKEQRLFVYADKISGPVVEGV